MSRWFRRDPEDFSVKDWDGLVPLCPKPTPEPWRDCGEPVYLVPITFLKTFVEKVHIDDILRLERSYIANLCDSIAEEGLRVPPLMYYDHAGHIRYHDGHHRYAAVQELGYFTHMPVRLHESPGIKGYCRGVAEEVPALFQLFAVSADPTVRSSKLMTLQPMRES